MCGSWKDILANNGKKKNTLTLGNMTVEQAFELEMNVVSDFIVILFVLFISLVDSVIHKTVVL